MASHSSGPAWRIPGTGEPGGLPSTGSHRVGHEWSDLAAAAELTVELNEPRFASWFQTLAASKFPNIIQHEHFPRKGKLGGDWPGMEPNPLHWKGKSGRPEKSLNTYFQTYKNRRTLLHDCRIPISNFYSLSALGFALSSHKIEVMVFFLLISFDSPHPFSTLKPSSFQIIMPGLYTQPLRRKSWSLSLIPTLPSPPGPATSTF